MPELSKEYMIAEINRLKKEHDAVILAHNYQVGDIQDVADIVGDSFKLSLEASKTHKRTIVFCGVHFMAESAKILSPDKTVLIPDKNAGCPMADTITADQLREWKKDYPGVPVVMYVNSTAEVKAESDVCCTSSNALSVIEAIDSDKILFGPDRNLGDFIAKQIPNKELIRWNGYCIVHEQVKEKSVEEMRAKHPGVRILAHPELNPAVLINADFIGSTSQILEHARKSSDKEFIIATENGILHTLQKENPHKKFYLLTDCLECKNMKKITLDNLYNCMLNGYTDREKYQVELDENTRLNALNSLKRMLEIQ